MIVEHQIRLSVYFFKMMKKMKNKKEGQMIFKNIFEYHTEGMLNDSEFCEIMDLIYRLRWDDENYDPSKLSKNARLVWQGIEPTFKKSKSNAEYYDATKNESGSDDLSCYTPTQEPEQEVTTDDEEKIREFFNNNHMYIDNNYSEINASTINGNPKLGDFMGTNGFTAETMNKVYQQMKK